MKKALVLGAIAALGSMAFGCAMTDYGAVNAPFNKTHGLVSCSGDDRFANTQQTAEPYVRDMFRPAVDPVTGDAICPVFGPSLTSERVDRQDAKEWARFMGPYAFVTEAQVFSAGGGGTWAMGSVDVLPNGDRPIVTWGAHGTTGSFTCVGTAADGRYGGISGHVAGSGYPAPGEAAAIVPGLRPDSIAIDRSTVTSSEFCLNLVGVSPENAAAGYSTFLSLLGRGGEGRVVKTPVTRSAGLAEYFGGAQMTFEHAGVEITSHASLTEDGLVTMAIDALSKDGVTYEAVNPVEVTFNPATGFRTVAFDVMDREDELVSLYSWAIDAGLTDTPVYVGGFVPELGMVMPEAELLFRSEFMQNFINEQVGGPIDG